MIQPTIKKPKLDRRNFMFVGLTGQELTKKPGDINGQAFKLENLTDCTVWLLDHIAQVTLCAYPALDLCRQLQELQLFRRRSQELHPGPQVFRLPHLRRLPAIPLH